MNTKNDRKWGSLLFLAMLQPLVIWVVVNRIKPWILEFSPAQSVAISSLLLLGHWWTTTLCLDAADVSNQIHQRIAVSLTTVVSAVVAIPSHHAFGYWLPATVLVSGMIGHAIAFARARKT